MGVPVVDGGDRSLQKEVMSSPGKRKETKASDGLMK